jgi:hypothetical protein
MQPYHVEHWLPLFILVDSGLGKLLQHVDVLGRSECNESFQKLPLIAKKKNPASAIP